MVFENNLIKRCTEIALENTDIYLLIKSPLDISLCLTVAEILDNKLLGKNYYYYRLGFALVDLINNDKQLSKIIKHYPYLDNLFGRLFGKVDRILLIKSECEK